MGDEWELLQHRGNQMTEKDARELHVPRNPDSGGHIGSGWDCTVAVWHPVTM